jgi:hypothetical protein
VEQLPPSDRRGRFSDGGEQLPETPDKTAERRFSEGLEHKVVSWHVDRSHQRSGIGRAELKFLLDGGGLDGVAVNDIADADNPA